MTPPSSTGNAADGPSSPESELSRLTAAMCGGVATDIDQDRLERLLEDPKHLRSYVAAMQLHAELQWRWRRAEPALSFDDCHPASDPGVAMPAAADRATPFRTANVAARRVAFVRLGDLMARWSRLAHRFVRRPATISMLVAALVLATGLTVASGWRIRLSSDRNGLVSSGRIVGRIVDQHRSRWRHPAFATDQLLGIAAGTRLELAEGLVEIEFTSGARAILQGPAVLVVRSGHAAGLLEGRMTVRYDSLIRPQKTGNADGESTPESPPFVVHTPAGAVVDLGTEFGVDVTQDGAAGVQVFEGLVELRPSTAPETLGPIRLGAGDAADFARLATVTRARAGSATPFVRRLPRRELPPEWVEAEATTLFADRFDRAAVATVGKSETGSDAWKIHGRSWTLVDGRLQTGENGLATIPFVPEPGVVYRLSSEVEVVGAGDGFAALGFFPLQHESAFHSRNGAYAWMGQRSRHSSEWGGNFACGGPGTAGKVSDMDDSFGRHTRTVQIDTRGSRWIVKFFVDSSEVGWYVYGSEPPPIQFAAIGFHGGQAQVGAFDNVRLAVWKPPVAER